MAVDFSFDTNYLLGRGKVIISDDQEKWYDLGNTPAFSYSLTITTVKHKNSRDKLKKTDRECTVEIEATGTITLDTVHIENIRLFLLGDTIGEQTQAAAASQSNDLFVANAGEMGFWKNVANDETANFVDVDNISNVVVQDDLESTTYEINTDYRLDERAGLIMILTSGSIPDGQLLHIDYDVGARTRHVVAAAKVSVIEKHLRFIGNPSCGSIIDVLGFVNIKSEGEMPLITDDFASFTLNFEFLDRPQYYDGLLEHHDYGEAA